MRYSSTGFLRLVRRKRSRLSRIRWKRCYNAHYRMCDLVLDNVMDDTILHVTRNSSYFVQENEVKAAHRPKMSLIKSSSISVGLDTMQCRRVALLFQHYIQCAWLRMM